MKAQIPTWAYLLEPTTYFAYGRFQKGIPIQTERVPVWDAITDGLPGGDRNLLVVRISPEYELVLISDRLIAPNKLRSIMKRQASQRKLPASTWWVSHLVHLAPPRKSKLAKKPEHTCWSFGQLTDSRGKIQPLLCRPLPRLAVVLKPRKNDKEGQWNYRVEVSQQPNHFSGWCRFAAFLANCEDSERVVIFRELSHLLLNSFIWMLEEACVRLTGRIRWIHFEKGACKVNFRLDETALRLVQEHPETYVYPCFVDPDDTKNLIVSLKLFGLTRMPAPVSLSIADTTAPASDLDSFVFAAPPNVTAKLLRSGNVQLTTSRINITYDRSTHSIVFSIPK